MREQPERGYFTRTEGDGKIVVFHARCRWAEERGLTPITAEEAAQIRSEKKPHDTLQRLAAFDQRVRETVAAAAVASPNTDHEARLSSIEDALAAIRSELAQDRANVAYVVNQVASFGHTMSELIRQAKEG